jgi:putative ABC transport system permease protein
MQLLEAVWRKWSDQVMLFNTFSGLAIFISLLGLMAIATYSAEQRKKELSVSNAMGASII